MSKVKRRLATILAADCVDFSAHMEQSEAATLASLKICRGIIDPIIRDSGGRIFHTAGDSVIAEFASPVECVIAANNFQHAIDESNKLKNIRPRLQWRVGIHVDDIIIDDENIYGSGVNVAARLEAACEPGRVLLSRFVAEQVKKRVELPIYPDGTRALKNISDEFEVFVVGEINQTDSNQVSTNKKSGPEGRTNSIPRLAILPFTNQSNEDEKSFLVDGIVEDLITEFSMIHELEVLSRQTSLDLGLSGQSFKEIADEFSLDFFVTGAIRSSGSRVRISVELSDAHDKGVIWSKKFDKVLDDVFEVQDEIVQATAGVLLGKMEVRSLERAKRKPTSNMTSYELLLRGKEQHHKFRHEANKLALEFFDQAIQADPDNGKAYAWKACTLGQSMARGFTDREMSEIFNDAKLNVERAKEINENDFECHRLLCAVYLFTEEFQLSLTHGQKSYELNPNDPRILSGYGDILVRLGEIELGIECFSKALDLDPIPMGQMNSDNRFRDLAFGYFCADNHELCLKYINQIKEKNHQDNLIECFSKNQLDRKSDFNLSEKVCWDKIIENIHLADLDKKNLLQHFVDSGLRRIG